MLNYLIRRKLAAFEQRYHYDTGYARELLETDRSALMALARAGGVSAYKKDVPRDVYYAAKLVSMMAEDCGPCTQLTVAMALEDGVDAGVLAAVVRGDQQALSEAQRLGMAFARAVRAHGAEADELRAEIVRRWGKRAVVALGFAIVASRIYPTLKYALGHGHACQRLDIAGQVIVPRPQVAQA